MKVSIHAQRITLNDPRAGHVKGFTTNAVLVRKIEPTNEHEPSKWLLLTNMPTKTKQDLQWIIDCHLMH
ncbi:MAG TPA: hypothetical protein PKD64_16780 [Pirellulaceae bacterium]|nr:hypothetical protein [Pirellulaceae bacterium]HMO93843.1 hypothetical protein [Pirellulaceae bacterium]HMP71139.1 hypothetical protein [Pirellulaceae bacterium]